VTGLMVSTRPTLAITQPSPFTLPYINHSKLADLFVDASDHIYSCAVVTPLKDRIYKVPFRCENATRSSTIATYTVTFREKEKILAEVSISCVLAATGENQA
jgi:hypothetical protein